MKQEQGTQVIELPELQIRALKVKIVGDSPLIVHKWSKENIKSIEVKQGHGPKQKRGKRNPKKEYMAALYTNGNGDYLFPSIAFKKAAVDACSHIEGVTKVVARGAFHINGEFVILKGGKPTMRTDMVRIQMTSDIRYRPQFKKWNTELDIRYNEAVISPAQILNLLNTAGFAIGVGDWRPGKSGNNFGLFHVATSKEIE